MPQPRSALEVLSCFLAERPRVIACTLEAAHSSSFGASARSPPRCCASRASSASITPPHRLPLAAADGPDLDVPRDLVQLVQRVRLRGGQVAVDHPSDGEERRPHEVVVPLVRPAAAPARLVRLDD